jgi:hypothetical protein
VKVYRYWAKGSAPLRRERRDWNIVCFGGSDASLDDAAQNARIRAEAVRAAILRGVPPGGYGYSDRPLREELKREIHQGRELAAVITRNNYGSLVLNTASVMFIDIDVGPEKEAVRKEGRGLMSRLLGGRPKEEPASQAARIDVMEGLRRRAENHGIGMRVYRTPNGYRGLVTSRHFDPASDETTVLLRAFGSDELYIKMCRVQECFRARLTPKPFRIKVPNPPSRFPWVEREKEIAHREWERHYEGVIANYSACSFLGHLGDGSMTEDVAQIVQVHDSVACTGRPLA